MKRCEPINFGWQDILPDMPYCPEGHSTAQEIAEKTHRSVVTVRTALNKANVPFIYGLTEDKRKARYYKDK